MTDNAAYIDRDLRIDGSPTGPLAGLTFVAKDTYDIKGHRTGFGNPTWKDTHPPATETAPAVQVWPNHKHPRKAMYILLF